MASSVLVLSYVSGLIQKYTMKLSRFQYTRLIVEKSKIFQNEHHFIVFHRYFQSNTKNHTAKLSKWPVKIIAQKNYPSIPALKPTDFESSKKSNLFEKMKHKKFIMLQAWRHPKISRPLQQIQITEKRWHKFFSDVNSMWGGSNEIKVVWPCLWTLLPQFHWWNIKQNIIFMKIAKISNIF